MFHITSSKVFTNVTVTIWLNRKKISSIIFMFDSYFLITVYTPNSGSELKRLDVSVDDAIKTIVSAGIIKLESKRNKNS